LIISSIGWDVVAYFIMLQCNIGEVGRVFRNHEGQDGGLKG